MLENTDNWHGKIGFLSCFPSIYHDDTQAVINDENDRYPGRLTGWKYVCHRRQSHKIRQFNLLKTGFWIQGNLRRCNRIR